ncbi:hypothetical protein BU15DRAFT_64085 [Melanogaster broomeanus]|nr:hypothetical protein BU15DRAFT_64085 [Melanogaster broomeanus]
MLELDEWDELLVNTFTTSPFSDNSSVRSDSPNDNVLVTLALDSSDRHPLRSPSVPSGSCFSTTTITPSVTVIGVEAETRPRLTRLLSGPPDGDDAVEATRPCDATTSRNDGPQASSDIIHKVGPADTFAGVALRYGVSIAALRHANQLWPSDPIHLRTELTIPRGDAIRVRIKPASDHEAQIISNSDVEPPSRSSSDILASTFVAARSAILSVLPARMSLESLSSSTSASEDHELEDLRTVRLPMNSSIESHGTAESHELAVMSSSSARSKIPSIPPLLHPPCTPNNQYPHSDLDYTFPVGNSHPVRHDRPRRVHPPAVFVPVRTSQLEPEPGMELPSRRFRRSNVHRLRIPFGPIVISSSALFNAVVCDWIPYMRGLL